MNSVLTVIGQRDPKLEGLVRASGRVTTVIWLADLNSLLDAKASQPDLVLIDIRRGSAVPSQLATLKRQHPATNVILLTSTLDPAVMLERGWTITRRADGVLLRSSTAVARGDVIDTVFADGHLLSTAHAPNEEH